MQRITGGRETSRDIKARFLARGGPRVGATTTAATKFVVYSCIELVSVQSLWWLDGLVPLFDSSLDRMTYLVLARPSIFVDTGARRESRQTAERNETEAISTFGGNRGIPTRHATRTRSAIRSHFQVLTTSLIMP